VVLLLLLPPGRCQVLLLGLMRVVWTLECVRVLVLG
jgi:hypothetical protein